MGKAAVNLSDLSESNTHELWLPLVPSKAKDKVSGDIRVSIKIDSAQSFSAFATNTTAAPAAVRNSHPSYYQTQTNEQDSPLFQAIKDSNLPKVSSLLCDTNTNVNEQDRHGYTPLHSAACIFSDTDDEIVVSLLNHPSRNKRI